METNFKRNSKKRARETKARSHVAGASKRKREKEPKMKLSNYEKAVRKFNLNQQLCMQGRAENRRITKGPLKIKSSRDGLFLKARRSAVVRKKPLNEANEARKNEDINRIIDIGSEMLGECSAAGKVREKDSILKRLNYPVSSSSSSDEDGEDDADGKPCCRNHEDRRKRPSELRPTNVISSDSSGECSKTNRQRAKKKRIETFGSDTSAPGKFEDYLLRQLARSSSSMDIHRGAGTSGLGIFENLAKSDETAVPSSSSSGLKAAGEETGSRGTDLDDFERFTLRFDNAVASVDSPLLTGPGISESALSSLRSLHRKRRELYEGECKMKKEVHSGSGVEFKSRKMYDPVLTWVLNGVSPGATSTDAWNAKFNPNIFTFRERPEKPGNSGSSTTLLRAHDPGQDMGVIDDGKVLSPRIRWPTPEYTRRDMF